MATRKKYAKKKNNKVISFILVVITLLFSSYLSDKFDILTYDDIFTSVGLKDKQVKSAEGDITIHYIDVGQGDCELIISGDSCVLIDAGEAENANKVINYIRSYDIDTIDYVIATHPHSDHIGALSEIIDEFEIGKIYMPRVSDELTPTSMVYEKLITSIINKGLKISTADFGEKIDLGDSKLVMYPPQEEYDSLNNYSIVCRLIHGENTFLFTGDAEKEEEKYLLNNGAALECDVLKVSHHGSSSSSIKAFLDEAYPSMCIISCGTDNRYNHPNDSTVERLNKYTDTILRTDLLGTIVLVSDGSEIRYSYENE